MLSRPTKKVPLIYHVVAMAENRVIGKENHLPWHFKSDLKRFKELTLGHTVIMGRKTFESLGKPLVGRENRVISRTLKQRNQGLLFFPTLEEAFKNITTKNAFIIGGAEIYRQTMDLIDGIYLTRIHEFYEGDHFYPEIPDCFKEASRQVLQVNPLIEMIYYERREKNPL